MAVSADALQLYRGLEILTGAATPQQRARLEHRLLGILPVSGRATAGEFARLAHAEIDGLVAAGRRPIVVGGTGLYLRAALADLDLRPPADPARREHYARRLAAEGAPALHAELAARDPEAAAPPRRPTASGSSARSSCSTRAAAARRAASCGRATPATRPCWSP